MRLRAIMTIVALLGVACVAAHAQGTALAKNYRYVGAIGDASGGLLDSAKDVAVDKYGNVYVVENSARGSYRIDIFEANGKYYDNFARSSEEDDPGGAAGKEAKEGEIRRPTCAAVDSQDRLYIGTEADGVLVFDAEGNYSSRLGKAEGITSVLALRADGQGNVYVSAPTRTASLFRYGPDGKLTLAYPRESVRKAPVSFGVDGSGRVVLHDAEAGIVRIGADGKLDASLKLTLPGRVDDASQVRMAVNPSGAVFVSVPFARYGGQGAMIGAWDDKGKSLRKPAQLPGTVLAMSARDDSSLYVVAEGRFSQNPDLAKETVLTRVFRYGADGAETARYGSDVAPGRFNKIASLAAVATGLGGDVLVCDRSGMMHQMSKEGRAMGIYSHYYPCAIVPGPDRGVYRLMGNEITYLDFRANKKVWKSFRGSGGGFLRPTDAALGASGLYVLDQAGNRIVKLNPGDFSVVGDVVGGGKGEKLQYPSGVALSADGATLYVSEFGGQRRLVALNAADGTLKSVLAKDLQTPTVPRVGPDGGVFVVEMRGKKVTKFSPAGEKLFEFTQAGTQTIDAPVAVAVGANGIVYIGDNATSLVQVFVPTG
jgi:streptogramin lyase